MKPAPGRAALIGLAVVLLLAGAVLALAFVPPFPQARALLDHFARDGSLDSFSAGLHAGLRPLGAMGLLLALTGAAGLAFRKHLLIRFGPAWSAAQARWGADASAFRAGLRIPAAERRDWLWLLAIVVCAGLTQGLFLDQPLNHDEAYTVMVFAPRTLLAAVSDYHLPNNHILHTVLVHFSLRLLGDAPWSVRLPAFLAYLALVPAAYLAARRLFSRPAGLAAAALIAALPVFQLYAANARGYSLLALAALLALALAARLRERDNRIAWLLLAVVVALGFWTLPVMLFPFGMLMTWLALAWLVNDIGSADRRAFLRHWLLCGLSAAALTVLLYTPVLIYSGLDSLTGNTFVQARPWDLLWIDLFARLGVTFVQWASGIPLPLAAALAAAAAGALAFHNRLSSMRVPFLLAGLLWLAVQITIQRVAPETRVWFFLLPLLLVYAGAGLAGLVRSIGPARAGIWTGALLGVILALGLASATARAVAHPPSAPGTNERVIAALQDMLQPGDEVVTAYADAPPLWYYASRAGLDPQRLTGAAEDPFARAVVLVNQDLGQTLASVLEEQAVQARVDPSAASLLGQIDRTFIYALPPVNP